MILTNELKRFLGKQIKVHLGRDWNYFGRLESIKEDDNAIVLRTEAAELVVMLNMIVAISHVPSADSQNRNHFDTSPYHPARVR